MSSLSRYKIVCEYIGQTYTGWQRLSISKTSTTTTTTTIDGSPVNDSTKKQEYKYKYNKYNKYNKYRDEEELDDEKKVGPRENGRSIQYAIEHGLSHIMRQRIQIVGSSRTDSGVNSLCQVAHCDLPNQRYDKKGTIEQEQLTPSIIKIALNQQLKRHNHDIRIVSVEKVDNEFHSRYNATSRTYLYKIMTGVRPTEVPLELKNKVWPIWETLDIDQMKETASFLQGLHDFDSLRSAKCQAKSPIRSISHIKIIDLPLPDIWRYNNDDSTPPKIQYIGLEIKGRSFLHNQVRIMSSCLAEIGRGHMTLDNLKEIMKGRDRTLAPATAPAYPLTLVKVSYGENIEIDDTQTIRLQQLLDERKEFELNNNNINNNNNNNNNDQKDNKKSTTNSPGLIDRLLTLLKK
ncbi:hypothetical protein DFA_06158 [Cavenderia fasciculata]|uniref:tRNA pseudouridine synthase n=1 Tax=Cavenderia fasciculata TaxID=261658 RepID=F4PK96_CACFS|nr:uncharacterized protein DFA_06158 [Cavenderia fasciculata]EGG24020.1 hypothetical protein DFA_06158 [Cavenderia fasciculata]|eukprot:XP_004361871.1 hypothetical protein DFA_06158 [Cavenderia fasciculata]